MREFDPASAQPSADDACVFCEIVAGREPSDKVYGDENTLAFMDIDPGTEGHLLVIPKPHSTDLVTIPPEDLAAVTLVAQRIAQTMTSSMGAEGITLMNCCGSVGWQSVFHFHLHVNPRYRDKSKDRMELPFEPGHESDPEVRARYAASLAAALEASEPES